MTDDSARPLAVDAAAVAPRSMPSSYPEPFRSGMARREKRQLGDVFLPDELWGQPYHPFSRWRISPTA
ncbi:unnamed protein product [Discosporangium mesarthrocarpum]